MFKMMPTTLVFLATCLIAACALKPEPKADLKNMGDADVHAVSDQVIRTVMQNMKSKTVDNDEIIFKNEEEKEKYFRESVDVANSVQASADFITGIGERLQLTRQEQLEFSRLASTLSQQAGEVRKLAVSEKANAVRNKMNQMIGTCNSCHDRFRVMSAE
ncbi:Cytochrome C' [Mariprofundus aestuarium]|uniref:Cytochrome C n=1 Tax=Mariprofundus aestuarium TaxID=1921086 RepID=A0A2K8L4F5_MARES|nr:cytochrome c [Mariprofundus aestuarium]ATX79116.1 Cytochrome C' [Mariprofundus aestuarium]